MFWLKRIQVKLIVFLYSFVLFSIFDLGLSLFLLRSPSSVLNKLYKKNIYSQILGASNYSSHQPNIDLELSKVNGTWMKNYIIHPYLGYVDYSKVDSNRFGFIGSDPLEPKANNEVVVGIFGGSVAEMLYGLQAGEIASSLSDLPYFYGKKIRLVSMAHGGYKQPQQLFTLNYFLSLGVKFDMVINLDGFNEIVVNSNFKTPYFPNNWAILSQNFNNSENLSILSNLNLVTQKRQKLMASFSNSPARHSQILSLFWYLLDHGFKTKEYRLNQALYSSASSIYQSYGPEQISDPVKFIDRSFSIWQESSLQMAKICQINNIPYFQFLQPNQFLNGSKQLTSQEEIIISDSSDKDNVDIYYPKMIEYGNSLRQKYNIKFHDLTQIFKSHQETIFSDNCCHFNELGNQILSAAIVESIASDLRI